MRFINLYFVGYLLLLFGIILGLWKAGILHNVSPAWVVIGLVIAIGLGVMMSVGSAKPTTITRE